jgi:glycosyltransferase involved in cell wall biosynthesis
MGMKEDLGVTLIAWSFNDLSGFGAARYAGNLLKELESMGKKTRAIDCGGHPSVPWDPSWRFTWYFNLVVLSRIPATPIYHFTMDRASYAIPLLRRIYGTKSVVSILDTEYSNPGERGSHLLKSGCLKKAVEDADLLIATSSSISHDLVERLGADPAKVREIPLSISGWIAPAKKTHDAFTVGYLGRFEHHNNVEFLIRAFAALKRKTRAKIRLVLCGTGPRIDDCKKLAAALNIKDVEFRGFIRGDKVSDEYNSFDVFVFPSIVEGFGLPAVEAQCCGVPVIVIASAHIPEEVTRYCQKARDEEHAADIMLAICEKGFRMGDEQREYLKRFTNRSVAEQTCKVYEELL